MAEAMGVFAYAGGCLPDRLHAVHSRHTCAPGKQGTAVSFLDGCAHVVFVFAYPYRLLRRTPVLCPSSAAPGAAPSWALAGYGGLSRAGAAGRYAHVVAIQAKGFP